jgi:hypothetical protein
LKKNREDLKELCGSIVEIMRIVRDQNSSQGDTAAIKLQGLCGELERCVLIFYERIFLYPCSSLQEILNVVTPLRKEPKRLRDRFQGMMKLSRTTDEIRKYENKIRELRLNFMVYTFCLWSEKSNKHSSLQQP